MVSEQKKVEDINELKQSIMSHEYYFVLRGKKLGSNITESTKKIEVTTQVHGLLVQWMFNISDDLCPFCGKKPTHTQEITRKSDNNKIEFHLCDTCKIKLI